MVANYPRRVVVHRYGGTWFSIQLADPCAEGWYDHDWPDLPEIVFLRASRLRPRATVFDLGAHQAVVALMLAAEVGSEGQIVAVEAELHNARVARQNAALNRAANVKVVHAAVSEATGFVRFAEGLNGHVDRRSRRVGRISVPAMTIDQLAEIHGDPDVVFVDVEGYEARLSPEPRRHSQRPTPMSLSRFTSGVGSRRPTGHGEKS
jgi:FkbM family methyltransferase